MLDGQPVLTMDGRVEAFTDNKLYLWVWCPAFPDEAVGVDVFLNGSHIGQFQADRYREDLFRANVGDGRHALILDLEDIVKEIDQTAVLKIEAYTTGPVRWRIGSIEHDRTLPDFAAITELKADKIGSFFEKSLRRLAARPAAWNHPTAAYEMADQPKFDQMLAPVADLNRQIGSASISKYADFVRYRFVVDARFKIELGGGETANYLKWYLESYCVMRGDRRAPLSAGEISYLNEMILLGGQKHHLTRATLFFLFDNKNLLAQTDLNSDESYVSIVYWWSIELAKSLYVEDCLVPAQYRSVLLGVRQEWRTSDYPLSRFMEIFFSRSQYWHFLSLDSSQDRMLFYVILLLLGLTTPFILQYVPRRWVSKLIESGEDGTSGLCLVAKEVFSEPRHAVMLADYRKLTRSVGFDVDNMRHVTLSSKGNRILSAALPRPVADSGFVDVQIIGPMRKASGLGQAARMSTIAIARTGRSWSAYDFDLDHPSPVGLSTEIGLSKLQNAAVNILHLNAESIPLAFAFMPDVFTGAYNIGYFFWELDSPARCHTLALELLDEIWVSSQYGVDIYRNATRAPVTKVGLPYEETDVPDRVTCRNFLKSRLGIDKDEFVFLAAFDSFSFVQRKNPQGLVHAFRQAFKDGERVRLVMKTHNKDFVTDPAQLKIWHALAEAISEEPRITIVNETLSYPELIRMKAGTDCYISLHRSEGWGFGMVEAMNLGIPVIATGYSGNMEFCNEETCWLVDYDLRPLDRDEYIFVSPGQKWAEPRLESAVQRMRDVFHDGDKRGARAAAAKRFVGERFSPAAISARYAARLDEIFSSLGLNANVSAETSSRRSVRRRRSGSPDDLRAGGSVHLGG